MDLSIIVSLIALIVSFWVALRQIELSRQTNTLPIIIDMFREFRSSEFKEHLRFIFDDLNKVGNPENGFKGLPTTAKNHVITVSHFFDNLAVLVANNIIDEKLIISFMGESIEKTWNILEPYILGERIIREKETHGEYQEYFEDLVVRIRKNPPYEIRKKLKLQDLKQLNLT